MKPNSQNPPIPPSEPAKDTLKVKWRASWFEFFDAHREEDILRVRELALAKGATEAEFNFWLAEWRFPR